MKYRIILFFLIGLDVSILIFQTSQISISPSEARLLYGQPSFLQYLVKFSLNIFGQNDFGLRFVMVSLHVSSVILLYLISARYLKLQRNRLWLIFVFILLPGVVSSALVVSHAGLIIFGLFLYIYLSQKINDYYLAPLLLLYVFADAGFMYLFLGLSVYYLFEKNKILFLYNLTLFGFCVYLYGTHISGVPSGHFLDTIGVYSAIFTPIIFIYLFYILYRGYLNNENDKIWYIATTTLLYSLILSFRQRVALEIFAPYLMLTLPLAARTFASSYRVRLKQHRRKYKAIFILAFVFLFLNTLLVLFNKELYLVLDNPKKNFAYNMNIAKELASKLHDMHISCVKTDANMQRRLKFYSIGKCDKNILKELQLDSNEKNNVTIRYKNRVLYKANVTKLNNK